MQYRAEKIGLHEEFLSAPRLDNLTSVQALVDGILEGERKEGLNVIAIFDHEEVGSRTKQGAGSMMLPYLLEKIYLSLGGSEQMYKNALAEGLLMSVDVSHGFHPSYGGKYDPTNKNMLNQGFCIKEACSQSYATDSEAVGIVQQICEKNRFRIKICKSFGCDGGRNTRFNRIGDASGENGRFGCAVACNAFQQRTDGSKRSGESDQIYQGIFSL